MATIRQILTDWQTAAGTGMVSVMYFDADADVELQRERINDLFTDMSPGLSTQVEWVVRTAGVELDDATGGLVNSWAEPTTRVGQGDGEAESVPDASQILLRWRTPDVVNGRFVVGRTFVPGLTNGNLAQGNIATAALSVFQAAATDFRASLADFRVWHRPIAGSGGSSHNPNAAQVWPELAVLRRRRK